MEKYTITGRIGEGAHGIILRGKEIASGREVALKKVLVKHLDEGIPCQIIREIKTMQMANCKYVMELLDYFPHVLSFVLVFQYMPSGLSEMIHDYDHPMSEAQMKSYMVMLLRGVRHLHENGIMHRDLKPANLLIGEDGILRIGDFGLGRMMWNENRKNKLYTHQIATRWYRAPEILYGARNYNHTVDLWAVGCIIAEILNKEPLFPGDTDIDQLAMVIRTLGTPNESSWPGLQSLPDFNKITFPPSEPVPWEDLLPDVPSTGVDLVKSLILYDGNQRISAAKALTHPYFFTNPLPMPEKLMPKPPIDHRELLKTKYLKTFKSPSEMFDQLLDVFDMVL
ncbi:hypothetical protein AAG570_003205 [Ranatra chinensis]|uniref:Cyclin-dependent kinase 20 n=1 Tax=Ranatra chinensis TaxID=642074 RepID=A0ABD0YUK1_9HEMI